MNEKTCCLFSLFIALNASAGISFAPGDLLFLRPVIAFVNSFQVMSVSSVASISRWVIRSSALSDTSFLLLNSFSQCACIIVRFSLSLVVLVPSGLVSAICLGRM